MDYAKACIQPGYDYFHQKIELELCRVVDAFKLARLFIPTKINDIKPDNSSVDSLRAFKFLGQMDPRKLYFVNLRQLQ